MATETSTAKSYLIKLKKKATCSAGTSSHSSLYDLIFTFTEHLLCARPTAGPFPMSSLNAPPTVARQGTGVVGSQGPRKHMRAQASTTNGPAVLDLKCKGCPSLGLQAHSWAPRTQEPRAMNVGTELLHPGWKMQNLAQSGGNPDFP